MGLLTDPRAGQSRIIEFLIKKHSIFCYLIYIVGIVIFLSLAHDSVNLETHFSENALLPGLVHNEFNDEYYIRSYYDELLEEQKKFKDGVPYSWLLAKFNQLHLDTYAHNFTLAYPLRKDKYYYGKNIYGIVRAPRAASTEAIVLSVPYRSPNSVHPPTTPSIALLLSFAKFCRQQKYWAKDIIFLITEHEQLGMQAWLEAYMSLPSVPNSPLRAGYLTGRAGPLQAAVNLEFHGLKIGRIDVKIEGLNGQLPNLDLVNLAYKLASNAHIPNTFKNRRLKKFQNPYKRWMYSFETLMAMVLSQSTGIPTGNHGLFHRFGIDAITLEGFPPENGKGSPSLISLGRLLEGIFRSLNNLIEKFHQSYFFYLLPSINRFVSIGLYIGCLCAFAGALLLKAIALWLSIQDTEKFIKIPDKDKVEKKGMDVETVKICVLFLASHAYGIGLMNVPTLLTRYSNRNTEDVMFFGYIIMSLIGLIIPFLFRFQAYKSIVTLNIISLMELATALLAVGMYNFSLSLLIGFVYVPFILFIYPTNKWSFTGILKIIGWILFHPLSIATLVVIGNIVFLFPEEDLVKIFFRGVAATQQAIVFSIMDSLIYGNWLFNVTTAIFLPNWLCFTAVLLKYKENDVKQHLKKD